MEDNYILTNSDRNIILKYLYTKPYQEVAQAISVLAQLPKLDSKINPNFLKEEKKPRNEKG
jgi:hypothetical protein|tara:strand:- start:344 stop:526 length:183 start_codon:yes stop_codon:yes gene_type:complete